MKKTAAVISAILLVMCLAFTGCGNSDDSGNGDSSAVLSLVTGNDEVTAGQTVRVFLHVNDCARFSVGSFTFNVDGNATIEGGEKGDDVDIYAQSNADSDTQLTAGMFVATTLDLPDNDLYYVDIAVNEDAKAGDKIKVSFTVGEFEISTDANGDELVDIVPETDVGELTLEVV